jgi:hypothetical protein
METFTLDKRNVVVPSLSHVGYAILDHALMPLKPWTRGKDVLSVYTVSAKGSGYIWMTNRDLFYGELWEFIRAAQQKNPNEDSGNLYKGLQFDAILSGRLFKVYTFVCGSIRYGGFEDNVY